MKQRKPYRILIATLLMICCAAALLMTAPITTQVVRADNSTGFTNNQEPNSTGASQDDTLQTELFNGQEVADNEVLVKFRNSTPTESIARAAQNADADKIEEVGGLGVRLIHSRSKDVAILVNEFSANTDVEYAEPNYIVHTTAVPNDPMFGQLWGLRNTGQIIGGFAGTPAADIQAVDAWDISTGGRANVVAVVDTGIDYNHPDLAANMWRAPRAFTVRVGGRDITCAAGTYGFNAITNTCNPMDDNNHGTHVAGTIGGAGNNNRGVVGVNWTASMMGLKFLSAGGSGTTANAINAIEFAIQAKLALAATGGANVRILNNSWGCRGALCFSQALLDQIRRTNTNANNMLFVAAAGNNNENNDVIPFYPANYGAAPANVSNVISVAATTNRDTKASFSNRGLLSVHLGAPGDDVLSTIRGGGYAYFDGTSMASPHVAGAAALVLSRRALNAISLKRILLDNVERPRALRDITITGGRLNVYDAIRARFGAASFALSEASSAPTGASSIVTCPEELGMLPGGTQCYETSRNEAGQAVGFADTASGEFHAFLYSDGAMQDLGTLGGPGSYALGINEYGMVVGTALTASGDYRAFLYRDGAMIDLNSLIPVESGWVLTQASSISDDEQIAGTGMIGGESRDVVLTAILPEPEPLAPEMERATAR